MNTRTRVTAIPVLLAASLGLGTLGKAVAQSTPVDAGMQPSGLDEISLTIEEDGVTGMPESIEAGRYLVKVTGPAPGEMGPSGAVFAQFPDGVTPESAFEDVQANLDGMPSWYLDTHFGGGVVLAQDTESWGVFDFTPGSWVVTTLYGSTLGVAFEVTGELATDLPVVEANVSIDLIEMMVHITDGGFAAGDNVLYINNAGAQIHFLDVSKAPDGTTKEQVSAVMDASMTGTPPADGGLQESDIVPVAQVPDLAPGVHEYMPMALEAGTYMLACWAPDPETGTPHAMLGMWDLITVK